MEIALSDDMQEKKTAWKAVHDLQPKRPVILFETLSVAGFVREDELICEDELLRNVERIMLYSIRQHETVNDDLVIAPYFRLAWKVIKSDHGVKIIEHHAENSMAYLSNFPIKTMNDISKLRPRTFSADREEPLVLKAKLEGIFGEIMQVMVGNYDNFFTDTDFAPFTGNNFIGITMDLFNLIGYENMMLWPIEYPDDLHKMLSYLRDDKINFYRWLIEEGLLTLNTDNQLAGPSSYGYVSDLPGSGWNDLYKTGELLGHDYVYCHKPLPAYFSGKSPDWDLLKKDMQNTFNASKEDSLEVVVRDVYDIDGDMPRISKWVEMTRSIIGI